LAFLLWQISLVEFRLGVQEPRWQALFRVPMLPLRVPILHLRVPMLHLRVPMLHLRVPMLHLQVPMLPLALSLAFLPRV